MVVRELNVENHLERSCKRRRRRCLKVKLTGRRGFPDRMIPMGGGATVFVETKTRGGRLSDGQVREHRRLRAEGYRVEVLWTKEHVDEFMKEI